MSLFAPLACISSTHSPSRISRPLTPRFVLRSIISQRFVSTPLASLYPKLCSPLVSSRLVPCSPLFSTPLRFLLFHPISKISASPFPRDLCYKIPEQSLWIRFFFEIYSREEGKLHPRSTLLWILRYSRSSCVTERVSNVEKSSVRRVLEHIDPGETRRDETTRPLRESPAVATANRTRCPILSTLTRLPDYLYLPIYPTT